MKIPNRLICGIIISFSLFSCAMIQRESRLVSSDRADDVGWDSKEYAIKAMPKISFSTTCADEVIAFFGPYIAVPLPIIPNIGAPISYIKYKNHSAQFSLHIEAPPNSEYLDDIAVEIWLNGKLLELEQKRDLSTPLKEEFYFDYSAAMSCGSLENKEVMVKLKGLDEPIAEHFVFDYRWRLHFALI